MTAEVCRKDNSFNWIGGVNQCVEFVMKNFKNWFEARNQ